jgi:hypothetical protein
MNISFETNVKDFLDYFVSHQLVLEGKIKETGDWKVKFQFNIDEKDFIGEIDVKNHKGKILFRDLTPESLSLDNENRYSQKNNSVIHYIHEDLIDFYEERGTIGDDFYKIKVEFNGDDMNILKEHFKEIVEINKRQRLGLKYVVFDSEKKILGLKGKNKWGMMNFLLDFQESKGTLIYMVKDLNENIEKNYIFSCKNGNDYSKSYFWNLGKVYKEHFEEEEGEKELLRDDDGEDKNEGFLLRNPHYKNFSEKTYDMEEIWGKKNFLKKILPYTKSIRKSSGWKKNIIIHILGGSQLYVYEEEIKLRLKPEDIWKIREGYKEHKDLCDLLFTKDKDGKLKFGKKNLYLRIEHDLTEVGNIKSFIEDFNLREMDERGGEIEGGSEFFRIFSSREMLIIDIPFTSNKEIKETQDEYIRKLVESEYLNFDPSYE